MITDLRSAFSKNLWGGGKKRPLLRHFSQVSCRLEDKPWSMILRCSEAQSWNRVLKVELVSNSCSRFSLRALKKTLKKRTNLKIWMDHAQLPIWYMILELGVSFPVTTPSLYHHVTAIQCHTREFNPRSSLTLAFNELQGMSSYPFTPKMQNATVLLPTPFLPLIVPFGPEFNRHRQQSVLWNFATSKDPVSPLDGPFEERVSVSNTDLWRTLPLAG